MVEGLEKDLKFEISAGDKKKVFVIEPAFEDPGHYEAVFYPTVETTYNYRLFGAINNVTLSLDFQCQTMKRRKSGQFYKTNFRWSCSEGPARRFWMHNFKDGCIISGAICSNNELLDMLNQTNGNSTSN